MRTILSVLLLVLSLLSVSYAVNCGKYVNPLTCANMEPPCFWDGHKCKEIYPKIGECSSFTKNECLVAKELGCSWTGSECQLAQSKFHCSSIKNEFDCTIENCYWNDGINLYSLPGGVGVSGGSQLKEDIFKLLKKSNESLSGYSFNYSTPIHQKLNTLHLVENYTFKQHG